MRRRRRPETILQASGITIIIQVTRVRQPMREVTMARPSLCTCSGDTLCSTTTGQQGDERLFKRFGLVWQAGPADCWPKKWFQLLIAVFDSLKGISASMSTKSLRLIRRRLLRLIVTLAGGRVGSEKATFLWRWPKKLLALSRAALRGPFRIGSGKASSHPDQGNGEGFPQCFFSKIYLSIWKYAIKKLQSRN